MGASGSGVYPAGCGGRGRCWSEPVGAIAAANSLPVALQASVFTEEPRSAFDVVERLDLSAVMVDDHTALRADWMPFAGRHKSGYGIGGIPSTMREMAGQKMIVFKKWEQRLRS